METVITRTAYKLTIKFQDGSDIPKRLKEKDRNTKSNLDSKVEQTFQRHVQAWTDTINSILRHVSNNEQAWRFIRINPKVDDLTIDSVTLCKDFLAFNDLLVQRRDIDNCSADELGKLCMLFTAFQREIENHIKKESI
ncbi:hypothetical protein AAG747_15345 [Rapidithrix thailandica]|uniref:Uncharacterized protein n=1 Tax=Rapidithrix thailandica TaxID=413964 RepID=A0AAW9SA12_9BACT